MSDHRLVYLALLLVGAVAPLRAQTAEEWRVRHDSLALRTRVLRAESDSADLTWRRARATLMVAGLRIEYSGTQLTASDTARLAEGVRRGVAALVDRYGPSAAALVDTSAWQLYSNRSFRTFRWPLGRLGLMASSKFGSSGVDLARPIDVDAVSRFVQERMAAMIGVRLREMDGYGSASMFGGFTPEEWHIAARDLSLSWAAVGRRCAAGNIAACTDVVSPFKREGALERYFDPSDYRAIVASAEILPGADSTAYASRQRCRDGADTACVRIIDVVRIPNPVGYMIRETFAIHAFDLAGGEALKRLETAPRGDAVAMLAHVAGVTPDSLVRSWRARLTVALSEGYVGNGAVLLSTLSWCVLLLLATGRRRPS